MPAMYEQVRDSLIDRGMDVKAAKTRAAKIYIARGKGGSRSTRAKRLQSDRTASAKR